MKGVTSLSNKQPIKPNSKPPGKPSLKTPGGGINGSVDGLKVSPPPKTK